MKTFLKKAQQHGELRLFDLQFAHHLTEVNGDDVPGLLLAAAMASNRISHGDTCLSLESVGSSSLYNNSELRAVRQKLIPVNKWRKILLDQKVVCVAPVASDQRGDRDDDKQSISNGSDTVEADADHKDTLKPSPARPVQLSPLVLDENNRLYLARYWVLEQSLTKSVNQLLDREPPDIDLAKLKLALNKLFAAGDEPDWQKVSVANAVLSNFCVITGGPGTGKTYTVTALLAALIDQGVEPHRIALAAPTGKASTRLTQSIQRDLQGLLQKLDLPEASFESVTLHKLLGARPGRVQPRHSAESPLLYDVVIIDEASMIDLPMMARTFEALAPDARIVLIGDKDQLHSVESGMVLGDICGGRAAAELSEHRCAVLSDAGVTGIPFCEKPGGRISDHIVYLEKSHRVKDDGGISKLASAVNSGDVESSLQLLGSEAQVNLSLVPQDSSNLVSVLREHVLPVCRKYAGAESPLQALQNMSDTGVLCALRHGPTGSVRINALVEKLLIDDGVIKQGAGYSQSYNKGYNQGFYHGRPLMITENSSHQRLFNGDHGLVLLDENNTPSVHFASDALSNAGSSEESDPVNSIRVISHTRLPQHETFYAMTVHKSQGSEYSTVVVVLPDTDSPILSRELLYTAITRARSKVIILANEAQLRACIERRSFRQSGLRENFWTEPLVDMPVADAKLPVTADRSVDSRGGVNLIRNAESIRGVKSKKGKPSKPIQQTLDF